MRLFILIALTTLFASQSFAYGSSGGQKSCKKPTFSHFTPPHLALVPPGSVFSLRASASTSPASIKITVKKLAVKPRITRHSTGYKISATLPANLKGYARISINATSRSGCFVSDGWLVKIGASKS